MELIERERKANYNADVDKSKKFFFENYKDDMVLNVTATAKAIGVSRQTVYNWIQEIKEAK